MNYNRAMDALTLMMGVCAVIIAVLVIAIAWRSLIT